MYRAIPIVFFFKTTNINCRICKFTILYAVIPAFLLEHPITLAILKHLKVWINLFSCHYIEDLQCLIINVAPLYCSALSFNAIGTHSESCEIEDYYNMHH